MKRSLAREDYYLGLDIGTNSVGWAVTDNEYNIPILKGKKAWGVRLFDEAHDAKERRNFRSIRRRKQRLKWRTNILRSLFFDEIIKIDPDFYIRMDNSALFLEDKDSKINDVNVLFNDKDFTDKDYHKRYPTIYHLRKELMENNTKHDVRLVFLAIEHIIKHRGHFLYESFDMTNIQSASTEIFKETFTILKENFLNYIPELAESLKIDAIQKIVDSNDTKNDKKKNIRELFSNLLNEDTIYKERFFNYIFLLFGSKIDISKLSDVSEEYEDDEVKINIDFDNEKFDENIENAKNYISDEEIDLIIRFKSLYDYIKATKLLNGSKYLSDSKVKSFEKHKNDLKELKEVVKKYIPTKYKAIFRSLEEGSYSKYCGKGLFNGEKVYIGKKSKYEDFKKYIQKCLSDYKDKKEVQEIFNDLENGLFMPLQKTSDNGVLPQQVHRFELNRILRNVETYLPFLLEKDETGLTVSEKIIKTFEFRVPYYIGPLNTAHKNKESRKQGAWVTFVDNKTKLFPWNYENQINMEKTAEDFIRRMTNKCTYLFDKDVLPKQSLIYQEFMVLNEINNLRFNGLKPNIKVKEEIFNLFKKHKKVTLKSICDYLISINLYSKDELNPDIITGVNKANDIVSSLSSYHKLKNDFFGENIEKDSVKEIIEKIIYYLTIYNDGGVIAEERIKKECGEELKNIFKDEYERKIKKLSRLKFIGWAQFSKEFLELTGCRIQDGSDGIIVNEEHTLLYFLHNTNDNLMEIIETDNYSFKKLLNNIRKVEIENLKYDIVDSQFVSPAIKRSIWQTLRIVKEIEQIIGYAPRKIFIEMARGDDPDKRTKKSRKASILYLYDSLKQASLDEIGININELTNKLNKETDATLRRKSLFLYYTQLGRDMYTGEQIDLSELSTKYDIDHIYPRSKAGQDAITKNLVLVSKNSNARKSDTYPLSQDIRKRMQSFWYILKDKGLITSEKYNRLKRSSDFTNEELGGFIDRQLVETRQSTKVIKDVLSQYFKNSKIVCVHANLCSQLRKGVRLEKNGIDEKGKDKYNMSPEFVKVRSINDYHHAQDAYLNIVCGNVYNTKFTDNPIKWIKENKEENRNYSLNTVYTFPVKDYVTKELVWEPGVNGSIKTIKREMENDNQFSINVTVHQYKNKGAFYNQTIYCSAKHKKGGGTSASIPLKGSFSNKLGNISKYGGFSSITPSSFIIYKYNEIKTEINKNTNKTKEKTTPKVRFDSIPLKEQMMFNNIKNKNEKGEAIKKFLLSELQNEINDNKKNVIIKYDATNIEVIVDNIKVNTKIDINGFTYYIKGNNENQILFAPARELVLDNEKCKYIKKIEKYIESLSNKKAISALELGSKREDNLNLFDDLLKKLDNKTFKNRSGNPYDKIKAKRENFINLSIDEQCQVLNQIINIFKCKVAKGANLKLIGLGDSMGSSITITKNIDLTKSNITLINESITGLYTKKVRINGLANC